jgi:hypothetical protein
MSFLNLKKNNRRKKKSFSFVEIDKNFTGQVGPAYGTSWTSGHNTLKYVVIFHASKNLDAMPTKLLKMLIFSPLHGGA